MNFKKQLSIVFIGLLTVLVLVACQTTADEPATTTTTEPAATSTEPAATAAATNAGINVYSETARNQNLEIVKSEAASENSSATIVLDSTDTAAAEGSKVIALNPGTGGWGGGFVELTPADVSKATNLVVSVNFASAAVPKSMEIKLEAGSAGNSFNLMLQPSEAKGDWVTFTVPLAQFVDKVGIGYANAKLADLTAIKNVGFWNPGVRGTIYIDDIHFE